MTETTMVVLTIEAIHFENSRMNNKLQYYDHDRNIYFDSRIETTTLFNMACFDDILIGIVDDIGMRISCHRHPLTSHDLSSYSILITNFPDRRIAECDQFDKYDFKKLYKSLSTDRRKAIDILARNGERDMAVLYMIAHSYAKNHPEIFGKKVYLRVFEDEQAITCQRYLFKIN